MAEEIDDGKVRVRCTGCGKRVKFPGNMPGQTFRCPSCKTTLIAPLSGDEIEPPEGLEAAARKFTPRYTPPRRQEVEVDLASDESPIEAPREPVIQRITTFLVKETERSAKLCQEIVANKIVPVQTQVEQIRKIRDAKAFHFRQFAEAAVSELDRAIAELKDSPVSDTDSGKERLANLMQERRGLLLFLNVMFEFRQISKQPAATAGTPGSAAPKPTTT